MLGELAASWAATACEALDRAYPYAAAHETLDASDVGFTPQVLHPAFHGSFDWHSSVHMQWSLVRLLTSAGEVVTPRATALLSERLQRGAIEEERRYVVARPTYERPYGWAWVTALAAAIADCPVPEAAAWSATLDPLVDAVAELTTAWLQRQRLPVRHGLQGSSAFALALFHESFTRLGHPDLARTVSDRAVTWYGGDTDYDTRFEPSATDVFSPALTEADLMRRVLAPGDFSDWLRAFLPGLGVDRHRHLLDVPPIADGDGPLTHLSGLALSRAWQLQSLASTYPPDSPARRNLRAGSARQIEAVLPLITGGDFMSTHWLVSFGILALDGTGG